MFALTVPPELCCHLLSFHRMHPSYAAVIFLQDEFQAWFRQTAATIYESQRLRAKEERRRAAAEAAAAAEQALADAERSRRERKERLFR